jgi:hypothetical protein
VGTINGAGCSTPLLNRRDLLRLQQLCISLVLVDKMNNCAELPVNSVLYSPGPRGSCCDLELSKYWASSSSVLNPTFCIGWPVLHQTNVLSCLTPTHQHQQLPSVLPFSHPRVRRLRLGLAFLPQHSVGCTEQVCARVALQRQIDGSPACGVG